MVWVIIYLILLNMCHKFLKSLMQTFNETQKAKTLASFSDTICNDRGVRSSE